MTKAEFERWIEDTEGSVCLECGKCGQKVDPETGLCPGCKDRPASVPAILAMVSRNEDMSPMGKLVLHRQEDGDIIVAISPDPDEERNSVEFCTIFAGGGRSSHTLKALYALMDAMARDNAERPIGTSETIPFGRT